MADRILLTPRRRPVPSEMGTAAALSEAAASATPLDVPADVSVTLRLNSGIIARTPQTPARRRGLFRRLESAGFRVRRLQDTNIIEVGGFRIDVDAPESDAAVPADLRVPAEHAESWPHHLVQLAAPPTYEWVKRIEDTGVDVAGAVSRYALFVYATPEQVAALRGLGGDGEGESFVTWTGPFHPAYRLPRELLRKRPRSRHAVVAVYPFAQARAMREEIARLGATVLGQWGDEGEFQDRFAYFVVAMRPGLVRAIARLPYVRAVDPHSPQMKSLSERSSLIVAAQLDKASPPATKPVPGYRNYLASKGLDGSGVVIGICDSGVDTNDDASMHPDLKGRLVAFRDVTGGQAPVDHQGHGTHVAGIALGGGSGGTFDPEGWTLGLGVAPGASFAVINPVDNPGPGTRPVPWFAAFLAKHGASIMNNSWTQDGPRGYGCSARVLDRLVRAPRGAASEGPLVLVFAAGNTGAAAGTITPQAEAKNVIVVGNSQNWSGPDKDIRALASNSSRGPAKDGRLVPTVVAPGTDVVAARTTYIDGTGRVLAPFKDLSGKEHEDHVVLDGTSAAAPHVSAVCALLIQWWRTRHGGANPSPAMLKALLVNGAEDLAGGPSGRVVDEQPLVLKNIPNNSQGWGRVCVENIVGDPQVTRRGPRIMKDQEQPFERVDDEHWFPFQVVDPTRSVRVTLAWTDAAGAQNAAPALKNDLDLEVIETIDGKERIYKGNVFSRGFSVPDAGDYDRVNNLECVYIRDPRGTYEVGVVATALRTNAQPPFTGAPWQDYALVIENAVEVPSEPPSVV